MSRPFAVLGVVGCLALLAGCGSDDKDAATGPSTSTPGSPRDDTTPDAAADTTSPAPGSANTGSPVTNATDSTASVTGPAVLSVDAPSTFTCSDAPAVTSPATLTLRWTTERATSVNIAIDSPGGTYQTGQPANGSLEVPAPCSGDTQTYYVIAVGPGGTTATKAVTTTGG